MSSLIKFMAGLEEVSNGEVKFMDGYTVKSLLQEPKLGGPDAQFEKTMDTLRCPVPDADVSVLSDGEKRRVALCQLLLRKPDRLLLDEPTNHLDAASARWLEPHLEKYPGTVTAITHDRYFLNNVADVAPEDRGPKGRAAAAPAHR